MYKIKIDFHFMIFIPTYSFEHPEIINRLLKPCLYLSLFSIG